MQKSELSTLDGTCRKRIVSIRNKTANKQFCNNKCQHVSEVNAEHKCMCCGGIVTHKQNYNALINRFDEIIRDNIFFIEASKAFPAKQENRFYAWVKIGLWTYKIDMRYFIEYVELINVNDDEFKYEKFFEEIKRVCPRIIL